MSYTQGLKNRDIFQEDLNLVQSCVKQTLVQQAIYRPLIIRAFKQYILETNYLLLFITLISFSKITLIFFLNNIYYNYYESIRQSINIFLNYNLITIKYKNNNNNNNLFLVDKSINIYLNF